MMETGWRNDQTAKKQKMQNTARNEAQTKENLHMATTLKKPQAQFDSPPPGATQISNIPPGCLWRYFWKLREGNPTEDPSKTRMPRQMPLKQKSMPEASHSSTKESQQATADRSKPKAAHNRKKTS